MARLAYSICSLFFFVIMPNSGALALLNICYRQGTNFITPAVQDAAGVTKCSKKVKKCICMVGLKVNM